MLSLVSLLIVVVILATALWFGCVLYMAMTYRAAQRLLLASNSVRLSDRLLLYAGPVALAVVIATLFIHFVDALLSLHAGALLFSLTGRIVLFAALLLVVLLLGSGIFLGALRIRLKKESHKYTYLIQRMQHVQATGNAIVVITALSQQIKQRKQRLLRRIAQCRRATLFTSVIGIGIVICMSVLPVTANLYTLPEATSQLQVAGGMSSLPFTATILTSDHQFSDTITVTPNHFGPNVFRVSVVNTKTSALASNIHVSLSLTMLDMNMGTTILVLQSDGKGSFSGSGTLAMTGNWAIRILTRTSDAVLHIAQVKLLTPY